MASPNEQSQTQQRDLEAWRRRRKQKRRRNRRERWARAMDRVEARPGESELSRRMRGLPRAFALQLAKGLRPAINDFLGRHSTIGSPAWFDPATFPWVEELEDGWEAIRKEAQAVLRDRDELPPLHQISPDHSRIDGDDDRWKVFFLKGYGIWLEENCRRCPETAQVVRRIPEIESAFFSILEAGKHIPPHKGPTRAIFTAHLALMVPRQSEKCWIEVAHARRSWEPGKTLVFDDTYKHEVRNDSDEDRVVLLLHLRRPVRFPASLIAGAIFRAIQWSPFVRDGLRNHRRWTAGGRHDG